MEKELAKAKASAGDKSEIEEKYKNLKSEYEALKGDFERFKSDTDKRDKERTKGGLYRKLLADSGIPDKRLDAVMRVTDLNKIELDEDGNIKDAETLTESIKKEWADFIPVKSQQGADVQNPPGRSDNPDRGESRAAQMVAKYRSEHYGNPVKEG